MVQSSNVTSNDVAVMPALEDISITAYSAMPVVVTEIFILAI